jgi:hypothetical protein
MEVVDEKEYWSNGYVELAFISGQHYISKRAW